MVLVDEELGEDKRRVTSTSTLRSRFFARSSRCYRWEYLCFIGFFLLTLFFRIEVTTYFFRLEHAIQDDSVKYEYHLLVSINNNNTTSSEKEGIGKPLFTSHKCRGDRGDLNPFYRYCEFNNLCLRPAKSQGNKDQVWMGEWFYFVSPDDIFHPFSFDDGTHISFKKNNVMVKQKTWTHRYHMEIKNLYEPNGIASALGRNLREDEIDVQQEVLTNLVEEVYIYDRPVVLGEIIWGNFGHVIGDELLPAYQLAKIFEKKHWQYMVLWDYIDKVRQ